MNIVNIKSAAADIPKAERGRGWRIVLLILVVGAVSIWIGEYVASSPDITRILGLAILVPMIGFIRLCPQLAALALSYAWPLLAQLSLFGLPGISVISVWIILWLLLLHSPSVPFLLLRNRFSLYMLTCLLGFLFIGVFNAAARGFPSSSLLYIFDLLRGWLGFVAVGILSCRTLDDLKVMLRLLPVVFLLYPLALPVEAWQDFFTSRIYSQTVFNVGLEYGLLNVNLLGSTASLASIVALANAIQCRRSKLKWLFLVLFVIEALLGLLTGARQFLISWLLGVLVLSLMLGKRQGIVWMIVLAIVVFLGFQALLDILPEGGFRMRFVELTRPIDTWSSASVTSRLSDYREAFEFWMRAPILGFGFLGRFSHNGFLDILVQTGIVGLLLLLTFCVATVRQFFLVLRQAGSDSKEFRFDQVIIPLLASFFVQQHISGGVWGMDLGVFIILLGAMLNVIAYHQRKAVGQRRTSSISPDKRQLLHAR